MDQSPLIPSALKYLTIVGIHPIIKDKLRYLRILIFLMCCYASTKLLTTQVILNVEVMAEAMIGFVGFYQMFAKYFMLLVDGKTYANLIKSTEAFWPLDIFGEECKNIVSNIHAQTAKGFKTMLILLFLTCFTFCIKPLVMIQTLSIPWHTICDSNKSHTCFYLNYFMEVLGFIFMCVTISGFDGLFFGFLTMAYCELEKIKYGINNLKDVKNGVNDQKALMDRVSMLVYQHNLVLKFIKDINTVYSTLNMNQMSGSVASVCIGIYTIGTGRMAKSYSLAANYCVYFMTLTLQIFTYCLAGEKISEQANSLAHAAFDYDWHLEHNNKFTKSLCMIIMMAQSKVELVAGLWILDLNMFLKMMQAAFSLFTLMQSFQE
nr:odorant receptor 4-like [Onthophagus taurus]